VLEMGFFRDDIDEIGFCHINLPVLSTTLNQVAAFARIFVESLPFNQR